MIQSGVAKGMPSRAITRSIQEAGIKISRSRSVLPAMRAIREAELYGQRVRNVPSQNRINLRRLPAANVQLKKRYRYRIRIDGTGPDGKPAKRHIFVSTDRSAITPQMLADEARAAWVAEGERYGLDNPVFVVDYGERRHDLLDITDFNGGQFAG